MARLFAPVLLWFAVFYVARLGTHIELKYWRWTSRLHRALCVLVVLEALFAVAFLVSGPALFFVAMGSHTRGTLEFMCASGLFIVVLIHSLALSWLVEKLDLPRGSENAHYCRIVKILDGAAARLGLEKVAARFKRTTPVNHVSASVLWTLGGLAAVAFANTPTVAPEAYNYLGGNVKGPSGPVLRFPPATNKDVTGNTTVPVTGVASSASLPLSAKEAGEKPDYETLCPSAVDPGTGAPEPQRSELWQQWFGPGIGLGAIFAGCANPPHQVGTDGVWVVAGTCNGDFRSLAVATAGRPGAILLWAPARFALEQANERSLLGATPHRYIGNGDIYTVATTNGTYVFLRRELSNGSGGLTRTPRTCEDIKEDPVPFLKVPPALVRLWLSEMQNEDRWLWPSLDARRADGRHFVLRGDDPVDNREITVSCVSDTNCVLRADGVESRTDGAGTIDVANLFNFAPPPPTPDPVANR